MKSESQIGITKEYLLENFKYEDGKLTRIKRNSSRNKLGFSDWSRGKLGYMQVSISIKGSVKNCLVHRLIWIINNGAIPDGVQIDHIDRDKVNNKIENLRLVSSRENMMNIATNTSGYPGVYWHSRYKKWQACIRIENVLKHGGMYESLEDAINARITKEIELFGEQKTNKHYNSINNTEKVY